MLNVNEFLVDEEANELFLELISNNHSLSYTNGCETDSDHDYDVSILTTNALYYVNFQYDNEVACYIKRVA